MKKKMNNKGISYVELVISIVLFVAFVAVLFIYISPVKQPNLSEVVLNSIQERFENNVSIMLTEIPFKVNLSAVPDCFWNDSFESVLTANNGLQFERDYMFIEDDFGNAVGFDINNNMIKIRKLSDTKIYHIFHSNQTSFTAASTDCNPSDVPVLWSTARSVSIFSQKRLEELKDFYDNSYDDLKKYYDVPQLNDFSIIIRNESSSVIFGMEKAIPQNLIVQAREYPISILNEHTSQRIKAFINIKVW